jgi:hypothetical protein
MWNWWNRKEIGIVSFQSGEIHKKLSGWKTLLSANVSVFSVVRTGESRIREQSLRWKVFLRNFRCCFNFFEDIFLLTIELLCEVQLHFRPKKLTIELWFHHIPNCEWIFLLQVNCNSTSRIIFSILPSNHPALTQDTISLFANDALADPKGLLDSYPAQVTVLRTNCRATFSETHFLVDTKPKTVQPSKLFNLDKSLTTVHLRFITAWISPVDLNSVTLSDGRSIAIRWLMRKNPNGSQPTAISSTPQCSWELTSPHFEIRSGLWMLA